MNTILNPARKRTKLRDRLRNARGAIDLASIMVGVLIIGIVGGVIAANVFAVIPWAQDQAAKQSLGAVVTAEAVAKVKDSSYLDAAGLRSAKYLNAPSSLTIESDAGVCWVAVSVSTTGRHFLASNDSAAVTELHAGEATTCADVSLQPAFTRLIMSAAELSDAFADAADGDVFGIGTDFVGTGAIVSVADSARVTLDLNGHAVTLNAPASHAAIEVPGGAGLTLTDADGGGKLTAQGNWGAGIGASFDFGDPFGEGGHPMATGDIMIDGANIHAIGSADSAGIGASSNALDGMGAIRIKSGTVVAEGDGSGAGIGGGQFATPGGIEISGGHVTATSTSGRTAGIGGGGDTAFGAGKITISGGVVVATGGGVGIGGTFSGSVSISGGTVTSRAAGGFAIGDSDSANPRVTVSITGGTVNGVTH